MDPSIVKFFEDDEDESMHSGADVEAFSAALTRDIGGEPSTSTHQPHHSDVGTDCQGSSSSASQKLPEQWETSTQDDAGQGSISVPKPLLEGNGCSQDGNAGQLIDHKEEKNFQLLDTQVSQLEQTDGANAKDEATESQPQSVQHFSLEGHSQSERLPSLERNPTTAVETDEIKKTDELSVDSLKQELAQPSKNQQPQNPQQLNVQQTVNSNESNAPNSLRQLNVQQPQNFDDASNPARQAKPMATIPFHMLIPILRPHLDKDRSMQLQSIFSKLRSNEVSKDDFLRVIRNIVGDQMLRQAVQKLQIQLQAQASRNPQTSPNLYSLQNQKVQKSPLGQPQLSSSTFTRQTESTFPTAEVSRQMSRELDGKATHSGQTRSAGLGVVNQEREIAISPFQAANKQPQHTQMPQSSFPMYGVAPTNFQSHQFSRPSIGAQSTSHKLQGQDSQTRQALHAQGIAATQIGSSQLMSMAHMRKYELQNTITESKRGYGGSFAGHPLSQQNSVTLQTYSNKEQRSTAIPSISNVKPEVMDQASESAGMPKLTFPESSSHGIGNIEQNELQSSKVAFSAPMNTLGSHVPGLVPSNIDGAIQVSSSMPSHVPGTTAKTPQKKSLAGQKKPLEASGTSPPSKKPKISGALHDQSIDHLNDVTAVSGVNLREEEEQLLCAPKGESRASEATRRVVQEEEERLILQRIPLQKKLAEITNDCGIKNIGNDVERCLSLCVEERLRGLITTLVKLSKQRVDGEKSRHRFVVTSDVGQQILTINRKMKEDWDKKQAEESEKLRKVVEGEGDTGSEAEKEKEKDKEKDDGRPKATKANKEEDDKMRTTAANVAARAAVGGDDMLSKWQLMAEQARQKREGLDGASSSLANKTVGTKSLATLRKHEQQESERRGSLPPLPGVPRKMTKAQAGIILHTKVSHRISMKDVISALEREPQMSKSTLIYRLYERKTGDSAVE